MKITVCDGDRLANVELTDDCPVENLLALVSDSTVQALVTLSITSLKY